MRRAARELANTVKAACLPLIVVEQTASMEDVESLIIEHLKGLRSDVAGMRTSMQEEFNGLKHRVTQLAMQVIG